MPSAAVTRFVVASRYMPAYLALGLLVVVAAIWVPETLSPVALSAIAPFAALLAITALGQMLVIMTGGIDLSTPGTLTLAAMIVAGVGKQSDSRIWIAILTAVAAGAVIGLVNGILIGGLKLNALIVTLATGQIVIGIVSRYVTTFPIQSAVPVGLSDWASSRFLGVSPIFWIGVAVTLALIVGLRYTSVGRRFQVVGANPVSSLVMGVRVTLTQTLVYVVAAVLYAIAGVTLAALLRNPGVNIGSPYLLGPIAAVVIGGASLAGGLASPLATFVAAFFLTGLNQMMRSLGLATSLQFLVFGLVIIGGMLISGDRIIKGVEALVRDRGRPDDGIDNGVRLDRNRDDTGGRHRVADTARRDETTTSRPIGRAPAMGEETMYVKSAIGIAALLALTVTGTVAASSAPGTTGGSEGSGAAGGALADYGEDPGGGRSGARRQGPRPGRALGRRTVGTSSSPPSPGPTRTSTRPRSTRRWSAGAPSRATPGRAATSSWATPTAAATR